MSLADDPSVGADSSFMRAFVPMRAYQRLRAAGLDGLTNLIVRNPDVLTGRVLVRALADNSGQFVVIDGSHHVAALRLLADGSEPKGVGLSAEVTALIENCPVSIVHPETDPAFVLALLGDGTEPATDPWLLGQRDHLLRLLDRQGVHHSQHTLAAATARNAHTVRRYHGYRALQQMMQDHDIAPQMAAALYPLFHAAVGRSAIRSWLDWDDNLCCFMDDAELDRFYRLLLPTTRADGTTRSPCITAVGDVVYLCDVLAEPAARHVLLDRGSTLEEAIEVINAPVFQQWTTQVGEVVETMKWDRRRFGPRF